MLKKVIYRLVLAFRKHVLGIDDRSALEIAVAQGLKIGKSPNIQCGCIIDPSHCWLIEIGDRVTFAPRVHVLAHDASTKRILGYTMIGRVKIGDDVFVGAGTIILPGVAIGDRVIVGAGSVVTKDIPSGSVAVGNPARVIGSYDDFVARKKRLLQEAPLFDESYVIGRITDEKKCEMIEKLTASKLGGYPLMIRTIY